MVLNVNVYIYIVYFFLVLLLRSEKTGGGGRYFKLIIITIMVDWVLKPVFILHPMYNVDILEDGENFAQNDVFKIQDSRLLYHLIK